jgi:phage terminase small subunit
VDDLTPKQQRFVQEYLVDGNATRAATAAGYSAKTAYSQGQRLLKNVEISAALKQGKQKTAQKLEITREKLMQMAIDVYTEAMQCGQLSAANGALKELGVLSGERVEKQETTTIPHEDRLMNVRERIGGDRATAH